MFPTHPLVATDNLTKLLSYSPQCPSLCFRSLISWTWKDLFLLFVHLNCTNPSMWAQKHHFFHKTFSHSLQQIFCLHLIFYNSLSLPISALHLCLTSPTLLSVPQRQNYLRLHLLNVYEPYSTDRYASYAMEPYILKITIDLTPHPILMASLAGKPIVFIIQNLPP